MLLTITNTQPPATDLGYLLHKHPDRHHVCELPCGRAHVFYPEATAERCTAALLLDLDPIGLVRGREGSPAGGPMAQYINDRPYVASSFLSVAISRVFGTARAGRSKERPELAETGLPLEVRLAVVPCRGDEGLLHRLFGPLGYEVRARRLELDPQFPEWGESPYYAVGLRAEIRLAQLLTHLYVLLPVLDDDKHYWVGDQEVENLLRHGEGWLAAHPERDLISQRYLRHQRGLSAEALARLAEEQVLEEEPTPAPGMAEETALEQPLNLNQARLQAAVAALKATGAHRVLDLGCGEGRLLKLLLEEPPFTEIVGMDVSSRALEVAQSRLRLDSLPARVRERIRLIQGSLVYRDARLAGFDAAAVLEVIEHLDPPRLAAFERVVFEFARPATVVLTTPNVEYNVRWENLSGGKLRHRDHRFEWTRDEFQSWAAGVGERFGYSVEFLPVGPEDPEVGSPTQMAVFTARREPQ